MRGLQITLVSGSKADSVRSYIANQHEHYRARSFGEEYIEFFEKNNIPRYVFE